MKKHKLTNNTLIKNDKNIVKKMNINDVIDNDSLIGIFVHLPVQDKIKIEMVCKRWSVIGKLSWSRYNKIQITDTSLHLKEKLSMNSELLRINKNIDIIFFLLQRCGKYLNHLSIDLTFDKNNSKLLNVISKTCNNVINFEINGCDKRTDLSTEKQLCNLFKINKNIQIVKFCKLKISAICLSFLTLEKITDLTFTECSFKSLKYFYEILYKVKSLKRFITDIDYYENVSHLKILTALNESECVELEEFKFFFLKHGCDSNILTTFLAKQKKLQKLECVRLENPNFCVKNLINNLPLTLQELSVDFEEDASFEIKKFKNLTRLKSYIYNLTDNILINLNYCNSLKILKLIVHEQNLTEFGETLFAKFHNLVAFTIKRIHSWESMENEISKESDDVNKILTNLSHCDNLMKLNIRDCLNLDIDITFETLSKMKKLSVLKIWKTNGNPIYFINFIEKALNLNVIHIWNDYCLRIDLLNKINAVKMKRGDKNILSIYVHKSDHKPNFIKLPLVHVYYM